MSYSGVTAEFSSVNANPVGICYGPDGNFWFNTQTSNVPKVCKITATGTVSTYGLPDTAGWACPGNIVSDGTDLWTVANPSSGTFKIYKITTGGSISAYSGAASGGQAADVAYGSDGRLWVTGNSANKIFAYTIGSNTWATYTTGISASANLQRICSDGTDLWFTEYGRACVGKITTSGTVTEYTTGITASSNPYYICKGPDGNVWFTERTKHRVAKITSGGTVTEYDIGTGTSLLGIYDGGDGYVYFSNADENKIYAITTGGSTVATYSVPTAACEPTFFAIDGKGTMMFTEYLKTNIGLMRYPLTKRTAARQAVTRAATR